MENRETPLLEVRRLSVTFTQYEGALGRAQLHVIRDLSASVRAGELVTLVGTSGSGKSLLANAVLGLLPYNARAGGEILYRGEPLTPQRLQKLRGSEIALVPQSVNYLDPLMKVGEQLCAGRKDAETRRRAARALARYGLGESVQKLYPFELSGGMARRVLIAAAVMGDPALVLADEPTPGLDAATARRVLKHFRELREDGCGVLLITHDLELSLEVADRVVVFYAGATVEEANAADFAAEASLRHPFTRALWRAMPGGLFEPTPGVQPSVRDLTGGCAYAPRCPMASNRCRENREIPYRPLRGGFVRCWNAEEGSA